MALTEELAAAAAAAAALAAPGEEVEAVIPAEPGPGARAYVCSFVRGQERSFLVLDGAGAAVGERLRVREAVSIAALCELAEERAGGGDLDELRSQLVALRLTENPPGIDEAEAATLELQRAIGRSPRLATPGYLDALGAATRRLEQALGEAGRSPFSEAMHAAAGTVEELLRDVEAAYRLPLS